MLISHKYKCIFIQLVKTGSTSIREALTEHIGRVKTAGTDNIDISRDDFVGGPKHRTRLWTHMPAGELKEILGSRIWSGYFKFAFVRNPWEREVSRYFFFRNGRVVKRIKNKEDIPQNIRSRHKDAVNLSFGQWLKKLKPPTMLEYITDKKGNILLDFIGRFENLQKDFNIVCEKIGLPEIKLPHKNKSRHLHYSRYYTEQTRQLIARLHKKDIEMFGYIFEGQNKPSKREKNGSE